MAAICFYFQIHQPYRLKQYDFTSIGSEHHYFDEVMNKAVLDLMCEQCYLPANAVLLKALKKHKGEFKVAFSMSGTALEQLETYRPDVLDSFKALNDTGAVAWVGETYYHSLSSQYARDEFERQVEAHAAAMERVFGQRPVVFRNTELLFSNDLVNEVARLGFKGILVPSTEKLLQKRSPNHVYRTPLSNKLLCLPKNSSLTAELSRHFYHQPAGQELTPLRFVGQIDALEAAECVNLFMDYGVFSPHSNGDQSLLALLEKFPALALAHGHSFAHPSDLLRDIPPQGKYDVPYPITWSYPDYNLGYLTSNDIQQEAINRLYELEAEILKKGDESLLQDWGRLQSTDHFFYMTHKFEEQGERNMFSPYKTAYDAYNYYLNVLTDLELRVRRG